jgi:hypothetical protein
MRSLCLFKTPQSPENRPPDMVKQSVFSNKNRRSDHHDLQAAFISFSRLTMVHTPEKCSAGAIGGFPFITGQIRIEGIAAVSPAP